MVRLYASTAKGMGLIPDWGTKIPHSTRPKYIYVLCVVLSCVQLFMTLWTVALQAPLSLGILQARILEWIAMPFSRGYSRPRDWTLVSCIAGRFLTIWATGKSQWASQMLAFDFGQNHFLSVLFTSPPRQWLWAPKKQANVQSTGEEMRWPKFWPCYLLAT